MIPSVHGPLPVGARLVGGLFARVPALRVATRSPERLARLQQRALPETGVAGLAVGVAIGFRQRGVRLVTTTVPTADGPLPVRVHLPVSPGRGRPLVLALHGGGFVVGSARQSDWSASWVARHLDAVVVAPDYRLAPTHRFPAAVDDCWASLEWACEHAASWGADPDRLTVMGESAGGNLAAVTCLLAAERGGPTVRHQGLLYPATDLSEDVGDTRSYAVHREAAVLSAASLRFFRETYLGPDGDAADWRFSPVRAPSLAGQPPTTVVLAGHDPLHDTGAAYAARLAAAGVPVRVHAFGAMPHGFVGFPYLARDARAAMRALVEDQRRHL